MSYARPSPFVEAVDLRDRVLLYDAGGDRWWLAEGELAAGWRNLDGAEPEVVSALSTAGVVEVARPLPPPRRSLKALAPRAAVALIGAMLVAMPSPALAYGGPAPT